MLSQAITTVIPLLAVVVCAAPRVLPSTTTASNIPTVTPNGTEYYLQAQPVGESPNQVVNNYLSSYHSGAGENNVTLVPQSEATKAFLNPDGGYQEFDLNTSYPWGFFMGGETTIRGTSLVSINVGSGDAGFEVPSTALGLFWNNTAFGGWLACNLTGKTTGSQLFWTNETAVEPETGPEGCERVRLAPKYL